MSCRNDRLIQIATVCYFLLIILCYSISLFVFK
nr:MAG TPA: hypothetical protein [Caudoviricetes sp.]